MTNEKQTCLCVALKGELDVSERQRLEAILDVPEATSCVILDLSETTYLDSSALGAFIRLRKKLVERPGGCVAIAGANAHVSRILEISGLKAIFTCFDSIESALAGCNAGEIVLRRQFQSQTEA